jgi:hypothetical protein
LSLWPSLILPVYSLVIPLVWCDLIRSSTSCGWLHICKAFSDHNVLNGVLKVLTNGSSHSHCTQFPPAVSEVDSFVSFTDSKHISDAFSSAYSRF